ncbi:phosphonoacetaldehyde dehydrogenase [Roseateles amylovorans]|uniref:Phosphonoacetaldehyde dehydrogenase n=1 Tax=Roseateles amylovorans TaxID=2978473 RepID=A0ABY6ATR2_9BURK|nr:phosphonoacetaldehyde dehydrogenase [Roseateles amylovorans]UXH76052.1 phosphonoacetaldehyde dehydrogenase [Roseateles amylovorans]
MNARTTPIDASVVAFHRDREESLRMRGERVAGDSGRFQVVNPYTGAVVGSAAKASRSQVEQALLYAHAYRSPLSRYDRASILRRAAELLTQRAEEAAQLITAESGLSLQDSRYEIGRVLDVLGFGATEALRDDGQVFACDLTAQGRRRKVISMREPLLGVITAITPFNHPMNQVAHKVVPSIASNNRLVLKPSEKVPLSALWFADLLYEAGLPPAMLQVITGDPAEIAQTLITHPAVELVTFTGGVEIGKRIAQLAGYRRTVLELGGNDPLIVCEDADLTRAAQLAAQGSYRNSGQRCTAVKRILVQRSVADRFTDLLVEATEAWTYGDPFDARHAMGTVIDEAAARLLEERVESALQAGARLRCGHRRDGALLAPTVLDRVRPDMSLVLQESFGPISPVLSFDTIDEAIGLVNASRFGLSSGVCTDRMDWATRFAQELQVGTVNVWEVPGYRTELTPFGGIKDSGLGHKEGVQEAIKGYTQLKTFTLPW